MVTKILFYLKVKLFGSQKWEQNWVCIALQGFIKVAKPSKTYKFEFQEIHAAYL